MWLKCRNQALKSEKKLRPRVWMLNISGVPTWFARYFRRFSSAQQRSGSAIIHTSPVGIATSAPLLLTSSDPGLQNKTDFTGATLKITGNGAANFDELVCLIGISGFSC